MSTPTTNPEPTRSGAVVRDRNGDDWRLSRGRWRSVEGDDTTSLDWRPLLAQYGPLTILSWGAGR